VFDGFLGPRPYRWLQANEHEMLGSGKGSEIGTLLVEVGMALLMGIVVVRRSGEFQKSLCTDISI